MFCVSLSMDLFVLCVACLSVFVNCLVKQFAICLGVIAILLLNIMVLLVWLECSIGQRVWYSNERCVVHVVTVYV